MTETSNHPTRAVIDVAGLSELIAELRGSGYRLVGPTRRDGAILYDEITSLDDLPRGWGDEQAPGAYRLNKRADGALFGYVVGPHSWKKFLFPPSERLWAARREPEGSFAVTTEEPKPVGLALLGVRACELRAIEIQDRVFLGGPAVDPTYARNREDCFFVVVQCGEPGGTCFCVSMESGPRASQGFDLALTEVLDGDGHRFVVEVGSERGAEVLAAVSHRAASETDTRSADQLIASAEARMGRTMETDGIKELLYENLEHPRWDDVADRCLTCANCTLVCPTCFCATVEDATDLTGDRAERWRRWDSCFTSDFSYLHGGSVRASPKTRYRQWMTHKLATWIDQFGTSGCVGCGRCITWCPVGIDLTEEVGVIRQSKLPSPEEAA